MKVLICDATAASAIEQMRQAGLEVVDQPDITPEELMQVIGEYQGMVVRSRTKVREPLIDQATDLKVIVRGGVGLDNIDVAYAQSKGISVLNTPSASSDSVAELAIGYMFALARRIPQMTASMKNGLWEKKAFKGSELSGKTLGLIGFGRIGQAAGKRAQALGMKVVFFDVYEINVDFAEQVTLDELVMQSDYISLHVPYMNATHNIIGAEELAIAKEGVRIINCGRGGTLDEDALYEYIKVGKVAGAALDVYEKEPAVANKLYELPQVIGSPHIGAATAEAQARVGDEVASKIIEFFA